MRVDVIQAELNSAIERITKNIGLDTNVIIIAFDNNPEEPIVYSHTPMDSSGVVMGCEAVAQMQEHDDAPNMVQALVDFSGYNPKLSN